MESVAGPARMAPQAGPQGLVRWLRLPYRVAQHVFFDPARGIGGRPDRASRPADVLAMPDGRVIGPAGLEAWTEMSVVERIESLIAPSLTDMGFDLVRVHYSGGGQPVLQIMCERIADGGMSVDDCAEVSRAVSALLDVDDPIPEAYELEVSSPGIDRPLTRLKDFERYAGHVAKVELDEPVQGRRRLRGTVTGVDGDQVLMAIEDENVALPFARIRAAKLVLTDALLAAHMAAGPPADDGGVGSGQE